MFKGCCFCNLKKNTTIKELTKTKNFCQIETPQDKTPYLPFPQPPLLALVSCQYCSTTIKWPVYCSLYCIFFSHAAEKCSYCHLPAFDRIFGTKNWHSYWAVQRKQFTNTFYFDAYTHYSKFLFCFALVFEVFLYSTLILSVEKGIWQLSQTETANYFCIFISQLFASF